MPPERANVRTCEHAYEPCKHVWRRVSVVTDKLMFAHNSHLPSVRYHCTRTSYPLSLRVYCSTEDSLLLRMYSTSIIPLYEHPLLLVFSASEFFSILYTIVRALVPHMGGVIITWRSYIYGLHFESI